MVGERQQIMLKGSEILASLEAKFPFDNVIHEFVIFACVGAIEEIYRKVCQ
jgi:hypothetical protein